MTTPTTVTTTPGRRRLLASLAARAAGWLAAWLDAYLPRLRRRRPSVLIRTGPALPGWAVRIALALLGLGLANLVGAGGAPWLLIVVLAVLVVGWPSGFPTVALVIVIALIAAMAAVPPSPLLGAVLVAGLPALVQLGAVAGRAGWTARIEVAALVAPLPRFVLIQAVAQPLALLGGWLAGSLGNWLSAERSAPPASWIVLPIVAVLGLGVLSFGWLPGLGQARRDENP